MGVLRGAVAWPLSPGRALFIADGVVDPASPLPRAPRAGDPPPTAKLVIPAFADWHFHWVQAGIAGKGSAALLTWLRETAWPAEADYADDDRCRTDAARVVAELRRLGTLAGAAYASPHTGAARAFLDASPPSFLCGPAVMTCGEPAVLVRPVEESLADLEDLVRDHGRRVAVSPRFALSCDAETLAALGRIARLGGLVVQTHLAETRDEVDAVGRAFPGAADYTAVYEAAGLVGRHTLLGHGIHLADGELARIAAAGATVVHCPTSNLALGSGRMPLERLRAAGVRWVLGTDVGAGSSLCMLDAVAAALRIHRDGAGLTVVEAFHRASVGLDALREGRTEGELTVADRPGALAVDPPAGVPRDSNDPQHWLAALAAAWERTREFPVHAAARFPVSHD